MKPFQTRWCVVHNFHVYDDDTRCDEACHQLAFGDDEPLPCDIYEVVISPA